jgi:hypothetical protein
VTVTPGGARCAAAQVKCLQIGREAFEEVLGPLQHLIDEDRRCEQT